MWSLHFLLEHVRFFSSSWNSGFLPQLQTWMNVNVKVAFLSELVPVMDWWSAQAVHSISPITARIDSKG